MDARQNFYNHNRLLFRFLVGSTVVFIGVIALLSWLEHQAPAPSLVPEGTLRHFSTEAAMADVTRNYAYDARYIHDMESYAELSSIFFNPTLRAELGEATLSSRLAEVTAAQAGDTAFGRAHVYHTSYYIGNLLVLPEITLHEVVSEGPLPRTAQLLEAALADLRAGAIKIQEYYDVAPPSWYLGATTSAVFYPTPSFPSLTVSEATLVFYVLAGLDPENARFYKQQADQFASFVFASGANFKIDIEYAIRLAAAYYDVMQNVPEYQELFAAARVEWQDAPSGVATSTVRQLPHHFTFPDFPEPSQFSVSVSSRTQTNAPARSEDLEGTLRMSLIDTRLPEPAVRLYEYDVRGGEVLPFALDLTSRQFPGLATSHGYAQYLTHDRYLFLSGTLTNYSASGYELGLSRFFWRDGGVKELAVAEAPILGSRPLLSRTGSEFLYTTRRAEDELHIRRVTLTSTGVEDSVMVDYGHSPSFVASNTVMYVSAGTVYVKDLETNTKTRLVGMPSVAAEDVVRYFDEQRLLLRTTVNTQKKSLIPESTVQIYTLTREGEEYRAVHQMDVVYADAIIGSTLLSPGGDYLATALTEGLGERNSRVLIFDINDGIIKKEINLPAFAPNLVLLDGWTLF